MPFAGTNLFVKGVGCRQRGVRRDVEIGGADHELKRVSLHSKHKAVIVASLT
jgi:hypothetical protein